MNIEHWVCSRCGTVDGPRAAMICHASAGICAMEGHEVVEISAGAAHRLRFAAYEPPVLDLGPTISPRERRRRIADVLAEGQEHGGSER